MSFNRPHLVDSDEPLREGGTMQALCGKEIHNAVIVCMWNEGEHELIGMDIYDAIADYVCRNCADLELEKRYVYGVMSGQEQKNSEVKEGSRCQTS